jgi:sodium-dependent phosphate cotransporter
MLLGTSTKILYKATSINPYVAILIGMGVTVLVQSSSITSSTLVPLAGIGVLDLESMFPLVLGADIGTTFTALMAAMVSSKVQALQIALVHIFFNVTGALIWYPIPFMRRFILRECTFVGKLTHHWRGFPVVFITNMYFLLPLLVLGISSCFEKGTKGFTALGAFLLFLVFSAGVYFCVWWFWRDGKTKFQDYIQRKQRKAAAMEALADDLDYLKVDTEWCKNEIGRIKDFAGHLQTTVRI